MSPVFGEVLTCVNIYKQVGGGHVEGEVWEQTGGFQNPISNPDMLNETPDGFSKSWHSPVTVWACTANTPKSLKEAKAPWESVLSVTHKLLFCMRYLYEMHSVRHLD